MVKDKTKKSIRAKKSAQVSKSSSSVVLKPKEIYEFTLTKKQKKRDAHANRKVTKKEEKKKKVQAREQMLSTFEKSLRSQFDSGSGSGGGGGGGEDDDQQQQQGNKVPAIVAAASVAPSNRVKKTNAAREIQRMRLVQSNDFFLQDPIGTAQAHLQQMIANQQHQQQAERIQREQEHQEQQGKRGDGGGAKGQAGSKNRKQGGRKMNLE
jgi:hypothetical protein